MPVINGQVTTPGGGAPLASHRQVGIALVDLTGRARVGYVDGDETQIVSSATLTADSDGSWTITLPGNEDVVCDVGDTLYRITEGFDPDYAAPFVYYVSVPATGGPYWVADLRLALPGSVDEEQFLGYLPLSGGTLTGPLTLSGAPTQNLHAATKAYVDTETGDALTQSANLSDLDDVPTARTNLGLGDSATLDVGTATGTVAAGDDARLSDQRVPTDGSVTNAKVAPGAAIALSKLATDPLARANHTGTQQASTIFDLATTVQAYRLDQFAAPNTDLSLAAHKLINVTDPAAAQDAATKAYVDAMAAPQPADTGFLAWSFDPVAIGAGVSLTSQTVHLMKIVVRQSITVTKIWFAATAAVGTLTAGQNFVGLYDSTGTRLATVGIDTAAIGTNNFTISSTPLTPGVYWGAIVATITAGNLQVATGVANNNVRTAVNGPATGASLRAATNGTGQTSLPSSITPGDNAASTVPIWFGLS